ncbi:Werner Syndrome-like exonuclease [Zingiber officinale]|uniref:3'-5' exonuclease domain-containing protein n=1 Tax=Zingiber officinale TaxID=94328 RepID=A0A8J5FYI4_ZINOF|nr:Werner Syndrome-like exonuclease [Zingiber officinale]KAG6497508.1 hypothetical protein ZIOFF_045409 [Zingiber officinale]
MEWDKTAAEKEASWIGEWDSAAEKELQAIEATYCSSFSATTGTKRQLSSDIDAEESEALDPRQMGRRLPRWGWKDSNPLKRHVLDHNHVVRGTDGLLPASYPSNGASSVLPLPRPASPRVRYPSMLFKGRIIYSRAAAEVEQAAQELSEKIFSMKQHMDHISLGFDIEWKPIFRKGSQRKAAVMQLCLENTTCYVMHIIHSGIPPLLKSLLEDHASVKVGIGIANDARKMSNDYNVCVEPLEDLSSLANLELDVAPKQWSLASLTELITCKQLEKPRRIRLGNWEAEMLSKEQLQYAATDAYVSWYLYEALKGFPVIKVENKCGQADNETTKEHPDKQPVL